MFSLRLRWPSLLLPLGLFALTAGVIVTLRAPTPWTAQTSGSCIAEGQIGQLSTNDTCCDGLVRSTNWNVGSDGTCRDTNTWTCIRCPRDHVCGPGENPCNCPAECPYTPAQNAKTSCITEGNQGYVGRDKCCAGLQERAVFTTSKYYGQCGDFVQKSFVCTNCGDGTCGTSESNCNCQDCVTYYGSSSSASILTATIEGDTFASTPGSATFRVTITNISGVPVTNIQFSGANNMGEVQLDPAASDSTCTRGPSAGYYTCQPFDLPVGGSKVFTLTFTFPVLQTNGTNIFARIRGPVSIDTATFLVFTRCGNGTQESAEQCDDGNLQSGDGCSVLCHNEADLAVSVPPPTVTERSLTYGRQKRLEYRVTVANAGPTPVTSYKLRTGLLPQLTLNASLSDTSCKTELDGSVSCNMQETLNSGGSKTITILLESSTYGTWPPTVDFKIRPNSLMNGKYFIDDPKPDNDGGNVFTTLTASSSSSSRAHVCGDGVINGTDQCETSALHLSVGSTPASGESTSNGNPIYTGYASLGVGDMEVTDVTGDGTPDIVMANNTNSHPDTPKRITVLPGRGDGTFRDRIDTDATSLLAAKGLGSIATGELNGDGKMDVLVLQYLARAQNSYTDHQKLRLAKGNGNGSFQALTPILPDDPAVRNMEVGDFNGDGAPDVLAILQPVSEASLSPVRIYLSGPNHSLTPMPQDIATTEKYYTLYTGDFDGDGRLDFLMPDTGKVRAFFGNGDGTFVASLVSTSRPSPLVVGDVTEDGLMDFVTQDAAFIGQSNRTFQKRPNSGIPPYTGMLGLADMNGDNHEDLLHCSDAACWYNMNISFGNGDGSFRYTTGSSGARVITFPVTMESAVLKADLNGDGRDDLVFRENSGSSNDPGVSVYLSTCASQKICATCQCSTVSVPPNSSKSSSSASSAAVAPCGNGKVDSSTESCDDGNTVNGDGCSGTCRYECSDTDSADDPGVRGTVRSFYCSNGTLSCGETVQQDSCVPGTTNRVSQYSCSQNAPYIGAISVVTTNCAGTMTCQDGICGYGTAQSSSAADCSCANGYDSCVACFSAIVGADAQGRCVFLCGGSSSSAQVVCSNGIREGNEQCDDGNANNGDGCSSPSASAPCTVESGWTCTGSPSVCAMQRPTLTSVVINGQNVTVIFSKVFDTCAHLLADPGFSLVHTQNVFCQQGTNITVTQPLSEVRVTAGQHVKLCHGNNANICSAVVTVTTGSDNPPVCGNGIREGSEQCEVGIACPTINCFVAPCPQQKCDYKTCSCITCPVVAPPACVGGVLFPQLGVDANGCERPPVCCEGAASGGQCTTNMSCTNGRCVVDSCTCTNHCAAPTPPACVGGVLFPQLGKDANGCERPPVCCEGAASGGQCTTNMSCTNGRCIVDSCTCNESASISVLPLLAGVAVNNGASVHVIWKTSGTIGSIGIGFCPQGVQVGNSNCTADVSYANTGSAEVGLFGQLSLHPGQWVVHVIDMTHPSIFGVDSGPFTVQGGPPPLGADCKVKTYQDKYYFGVGEHCLNDIKIVPVYFLAKDQTSELIPAWSENMKDIYSKVDSFYESQFHNKMQIIINEPRLVYGDKNIGEYATPSAIEQEVKNKLSLGLSQDYFTNLTIFYHGIFPSGSYNGSNLWDSSDKNGSITTNPWFWLQSDGMCTATTEAGTNCYSYVSPAHEFGHAIGMTHPWEMDINKDNNEKIEDTNFGNVNGSVMGYFGTNLLSGDSKNPLGGYYVRDDVLHRMIIQSLSSSSSSSRSSSSGPTHKDCQGPNGDIISVPINQPCPVFSSSSSAAAVACGNNVKEGTEQCDDGNTSNGDGCSSPACQIEADWTCIDVCGETSSTSTHWFSFRSFFASIFSFFTSQGEPEQMASACHSVCARQQSSSQSSAAAQAYRFVRLSASTTSLPLINDNLFGTAIAPMGDMDGDGTPDLAVFAPHTDYTNTAAIYILHLTPSGTVKSHDTLVYTISDAKLANIISDGGLTAVGDLDGNGVTDIAAGTQFRTTNTSIMPYYSGKVVVLLLQKNSAGVIGIKSQYAIASPPTSNLHCGSSNPTQCKANGVSLFGISLAYLGGPRRSLVAGSANGAWYTELSPTSATSPAELGGGSGTPDRMLWLANGGQGPTDNIRVLIHAGDLGINYYYVDATSQMQSTSRIYSGETLNGAGPGNTLCLAQTDDLDGNGLKDLITGGTLTTSSNQGAFVKITLQRNQGGYLTVKSADQLSSFTDASGTSHARVTSVAVIGDIDGDGKQDYAVGTPQSEEAGGTVWLLLSKPAS